MSGSSVVEQNVSITKSLTSILKTKGYNLSGIIGRGACGEVFYSEYLGPNNQVRKMACKLINTEKLPLAVTSKFLPRELDILSTLNHPNIVHTFSIFRHGALYVIFMKYAEMGDLLDYVLYNGEVQEIIMRSWFYQLSAAMQYLHTLNIVHRDIKCENILITSRYDIKLTDFGFSRYITDNKGKEVKSLTFCGTPAYVAPEVLKGRPYNPKLSDIWSMGVVLFISLNRRLPFTERSPKKLMKQQLKKNWKFKPGLEKELSKEVMQLTSNLLEPDCKRRLTVDRIMQDPWFIIDGKPFELNERETQALNFARTTNHSPRKSIKMQSIMEIENVYDSPFDRSSYLFGNTKKGSIEEKRDVGETIANATKIAEANEHVLRAELKATSDTAIVTPESTSALESTKS